MIGGISVSVTTGLGAAIVTTAMGDTQVRLLLSSGPRRNLHHSPVQVLVHLLPHSFCRCYPR